MTPRRRIFSAMEEETDSMSPIGEPNKQASEEATTLAPGMKDRTYFSVAQASEMTSDLSWFNRKPKSAASCSKILKSCRISS